MQKKWWYLLALVFFTLTAHAQKSRSDLEKERASIQREIDDIRQSLTETTKTRKTSLAQLALLQRKLKLREKAVGNINQEIKVINDDMYLSALEIRKLKGELDTLKGQYAESLVYAYKNRSNYDFLNFIFSAVNFNDALKRMAYLKSYRAYREKQADNIARTQEAIQAKIDGLKITRQQKDNALASANKERTVLAEEKQEQDQVVSKLRSKEKELQSEIAKKKVQDRKLQSVITAAIRREADLARAEEKRRLKAIEDAKKADLAKAAAAEKAEKPTTPNTAAGNPPKTTPTKPVTAPVESVAEVPKRIRSDFELTPKGVISSELFEKNRGSLPWPVQSGTVVYTFGRNTYEGTKLAFENEGWTIQTPIGQPIKSVFDGVVTSIMYIDAATSSQVVMIRHGKYFSVYGGVTGVSVSKDEAVKAGQVIGKAVTNEIGVGELDFRLLNESRFINPAQWLKNK